jgi:hypothetical protein
MSDELKIALTIITGVAVFVLGQIILKWFIEPIQEQRRTIGRVANHLNFYANVDAEISSPEEMEEAHRSIRGLSSSLHESLTLIPCYRLLSALWIVPKRKYVLDAASNLIGMSNTLRSGDIADRRNEVAHALKIKHMKRKQLT